MPNDAIPNVTDPAHRPPTRAAIAAAPLPLPAAPPGAPPGAPPDTAPMLPLPPSMPVAEMAAWSGISRSRLYVLAAQRKVRMFSDAGRARVCTESVLDYLRALPPIGAEPEHLRLAREKRRAAATAPAAPTPQRRPRRSRDPE
jgi:hypothetical protein